MRTFGSSIHWLHYRPTCFWFVLTDSDITHQMILLYIVYHLMEYLVAPCIGYYIVPHGVLQNGYIVPLGDSMLLCFSICCFNASIYCSTYICFIVLPAAVLFSETCYAILQRTLLYMLFCRLYRTFVLLRTLMLLCCVCSILYNTSNTSHELCLLHLRK